jgi:hypothetical protein
MISFALTEPESLSFSNIFVRDKKAIKILFIVVKIRTQGWHAFWLGRPPFCVQFRRALANFVDAGLHPRLWLTINMFELFTYTQVVPLPVVWNSKL